MEGQEKTIYNILGSKGHLSADSDGNGLADGFQANLLTNCSLSNNEQYIQAGTGNSHYSQIILSNVVSPGDTVYYSGWFKAIKGQAVPSLYNRKQDGTYEYIRLQGTVNSNVWEFMSLTLTITSCYSINYIWTRQDIWDETKLVNFVGNGECIKFKSLCVANLTKANITQTEMDAIVQSNGYFESITI